MNKIIWIIVAIATAGVAIYSFFRYHKKLGAIFAVFAISSTAYGSYEVYLDNSMTEYATNLYKSIIFDKAMFENTGRKEYLNIANSTKVYYNYLVGYGYSAMEFVNITELSINNAINIHQELVKKGEDLESIVLIDSAMKADLNRIVEGEKDNLNTLLNMTANMEVNSKSSTNSIRNILDRIPDLRKLFEPLSNIGERLIRRFT